MPWEDFKDEAYKAVHDITVSHRVSRKVSGALHEETLYSPAKPGTDEKGRPAEYRHVRKKVEALSASELEDIADPTVKARVLAQLKELGGDAKKAFADRANHPWLEAKDGRRIPIHKVRLRKTLTLIRVGDGHRARHADSGSNHHVEILEVAGRKGTTKWDGRVVSMFEAHRRLRAGEPVIKRDHPDSKFLFSLCGGDVVELDGENGARELYLVCTVSAGCSRIEGKRIEDARLKKEVLAAKEWKTVCWEPLRKHHCVKLSVDPLGRKRIARD